MRRNSLVAELIRTLLSMSAVMSVVLNHANTLRLPPLIQFSNDLPDGCLIVTLWATSVVA